MKPEFKDKWFICQVSGGDNVNYAAFFLNDKFIDEVKRGVLAHEAACAVYGSTGLNVRVSDNFVYWIGSLPGSSGMDAAPTTWTEVEPSDLEKLAIAAGESDFNRVMAGQLEDLELRTTANVMEIGGRYHVYFEAIEKYSDIDTNTMTLPKEVMDFIMG